jgi:nicotinamidase-related amidase
MTNALIIVDIQNDYFENCKMELVGSEKASENVKVTLEFFRDKNLPIVHMQRIVTSPTATFFSPDTEGEDKQACRAERE